MREYVNLDEKMAAALRMLARTERDGCLRIIVRFFNMEWEGASFYINDKGRRIGSNMQFDVACV